MHVRDAADEDALPIANMLRALGWFRHLAQETLDTTVARVERHLRA